MSKPLTMQLPEVSGRVMTLSLAEFTHRCLVLLAEEQENPLPNNALISTLCEGVRLAREYEDHIKGRLCR